MLEAKLRGFRVTFVIQTVLAFATVAGFALTAVPDQRWIAYALGAAIGVAQLAHYAVTRNTKAVTFKGEDAPKFAKFFSEWYQKSGVHYIFCKDLDWLDGIPAAQIKEALCHQGDHATLIVSSNGASACKTIQESGSRVIVVPQDIVTIQVKMSLFVDSNGYKEIIVQRKPKNAKAVKFIRTTDPIMIALAETVIAACENI